MRILLVTGRLAERMVRERIESIRETLREKGYTVDILVLPIDVISLADQRFLEHHLSKRNLSRYDLVVLPGSIRHDLSRLREILGVKVVKSPASLDLLKTMFMIGPERFSPSKPGEEVIREYIDKLLGEAYHSLLERGKGLLIGDARILYEPPPFTIAYYLEHRWGIEWILGYIGRYKPDLLYLPDNVECSLVEELVDRGFDKRIAVSYKSIGRECVSRHASIVYGVDARGIGDYTGSGYIVHVFLKDPAEASLLEDHRDRVIIDQSWMRIRSGNLMDTLQWYRGLKGYVKSLWASGIAYSIDADSPGIYALLLELLAEAGIGLVVVWENMEKLYWSLREISVLNKLYTLAEYLDTEPRDLGLDYLVLKDKSYTWYSFGGVDRVVDVERGEHEYTVDPMGVFKIRVNHVDGVIETLYIGRRGRILLRGRREEDLRYAILGENLVSRMDHAFYLGRELGRAEEALRSGKNYEQEKPLLKHID